jgi:hypothetical protein
MWNAADLAEGLRDAPNSTITLVLRGETMLKNFDRMLGESMQKTLRARGEHCHTGMGLIP